MGRYYHGDIEGKFWFAVQSSGDADHFGVTGNFSKDFPEMLEYHFDENDLDKIEEGLSMCNKNLGVNQERLNQFFKDNNGYNNDMIIEYFKEKFDIEIKNKDVQKMLEWYARKDLGLKILECVKKTGDCVFEAEC
jgi:hypothetical protein